MTDARSAKLLFEKNVICRKKRGHNNNAYSVFLCKKTCKKGEKTAKTLAIEREHGIILFILLQE